MTHFQKSYPNSMVESELQKYTAYQMLKKLTKAELKKLVTMANEKELPIYGELLRIGRDLRQAQDEWAKEQPSKSFTFPTDEPIDREREQTYLTNHK